MLVYEHVSAMEPMLVESRELTDLAYKVALASAGLYASIHPITAASVSALVRSMNSYYSNLIEGHNTHPIDIERALRNDYSADPSKRALQIESAAHVEVQELLETKLRETPNFAICAPETLCWIHREFYARLPEDFRKIKTRRGVDDIVVPGEIRRNEVEVGRHVAPKAAALPAFLARFAAAYNPAHLDPIARIIAAAASHHRFAWIHPFLDGNGRVARLFTHAYLMRAEIDGKGLWTISRGLARRRDDYFAALERGDESRRNDYDGRGNLSTAGLAEFCRFFLETCLDQIDFMRRLLDFDAMLERIDFFGRHWTRDHRSSDRISALLQEAFLRGQVTPGEAATILQKSERTARRVVSELLAHGLMVNDGPGKPLKLGFPMQAVGYYFPRLYPEGVEMDLQRARR